jgi:photosystem II stability/assembly factor-like uncharacterized protein
MRSLTVRSAATQRASVLPLLSLLLGLIGPAAALAQEWTAVPSPGGFDNIQFFVPRPDQLYAAGIQSSVYGSTDHGVTWSEVAGGLSDDYSPVQSLGFVGDSMVMSRSPASPYNYRSVYQDGAWTPWEPVPYQDDALSDYTVIGATLFALFPGGVIERSEDHGTSWTAVPAPGTDPIWTLFTHQGRLFASNQVINGGQMYRSDDLGQTWAEIGTGLGSSYVCSHAYWDNRLLVSVYHSGGVGTFWASTDFGGGWTQITSQPTTYNLNGMAIAADGRLAVGASSGYPDHESIWLSADLVSWENYTGDLPQASWPVNDLVSHDGWFFKTGGTVSSYRAPHPQTTAVDDAPDAGFSKTLTAWPNPLRDATTLGFDLGVPGSVALSVFDLEGRRVGQIYRGALPAGSHQIVWSARDSRGRPLPAGVYLARLVIDNRSRFAKLVVHP